MIAGDPRDSTAAKLLELRDAVTRQHGKALLIYGSAHFYRTAPPDYLASLGDGVGIRERLDLDYSGRWLAVLPIGGLDRPPAIKKADVAPDYRKFDRALPSPMRPVLISLQRAPFRDFTAEEFLGRSLTTCRGPDGCRSVFKGSALKLGQLGDAGIYVGSNPER